MANRWGKSVRFHFLGLQNYCGWWLQPYNNKKKALVPWKRSYDTPRQHIKRQRHHFANKRPYSQSYGFTSSHVWMWELDHKKGWMAKNWCFQAVVLEKTLESPADIKEIKPVDPKGNQSWIFIGRADAEAQTSILWPPDGKSQLNGINPVARKDWGEVGKEVTENEMIGWHHRLNGHSWSKLREIVNDREAWHAALHGVTKTETTWRLNNSNNNFICPARYLILSGCLTSVTLRGIFLHLQLFLSARLRK